MNAEYPLVIYDDDCGFCINMLHQLDIFESNEYSTLAFSEVTPEIESQLPPEYTDCFHILTDKTVYSCGDALRYLLNRRYNNPTITTLLNTSPATITASIGYNIVASNRGKASRIYSFIFSDSNK